MSTVEVLLEALDESRERLLIAIEFLDDEALSRKQVVNGWSIAETLSSITAWESELVTGLMKIDQNKRPAKLLAALADPASYDQTRYDEMQGRDLDQVFDDLQQVRIQVEDWLAGFSERDLTDPGRFRWLEGRALKEIIAETTYEREKRFLGPIEAFAQGWLSENDESPINVIPLTMIEPTVQEGDDESAN